MDDFIVLLARQRSGTNAVRSVLGTHPDVHCFNEVFNFGDWRSENAELAEPNFFGFLETYCAGDVRRMYPDRHERLFVDYLEYLRCFSDAPFLVIDVKYNTTHFLQQPWIDNLTSPFLFDLVVRNRMRVLHLTRRNYLRYVLSLVKARRSGTYAVVGGAPPADEPIRLDPHFMMHEFEKCRIEDAAVERRFGGYDRILTAEYGDSFRAGGEVRESFLHSVGRWLELEPTFGTQPDFRKQSQLPLRETIANFDEIAELLSGTEYEPCLQDEAMYDERTLEARA